MIRHESARLLSSFTIFDIVLDRMRLGKMGTSSHFLSAFSIFAQNRLWLGSPRANSDCYPIIKIWKKGVRLDCGYSLRYRSKYRNNTMKQDKLKATARLLEIMDTLREQCPWDRKQTFETLRNNTIEETYELADAILNKDLDGIKEEAGDLLLHVVFYAKLGEEAGAFDYADVVNALCDKLVYRHPHIYGEVHADTPEEVKANWEALKLRKKNRRSGTLGGVPVSLPALVKAYRIGEKAAATGFDWEKKEDVWAKVKEETAEVEAEMTSGDRTAMEEEFGDLLFALVNACRLYGIDPESALERSNKKFMNRFNYMEECASSEGHTLHELSLDRMEELWQQAKHAAAEKE